MLYGTGIISSDRLRYHKLCSATEDTVGKEFWMTYYIARSNYSGFYVMAPRRNSGFFSYGQRAMGSGRGVGLVWCGMVRYCDGTGAVST